MERTRLLRHPLRFSRFGALLALLFLFAFSCERIHAQADPTTPAPDATSAAKDTAPAVANTAATPAETASSTYKLQPYDLIDIDVYSEEDLHKPARLGADGTALLPLIGSVKLGGLTVTQATELITKKYAAGFVKNPNVLITVLEYRKATFSILGQVVHPGIFEIPEGAQVSIIQAISQAGGFTQTAAQNSVNVKRTVDGTIQLFKVKAADMALSPDVVPFQIMPGDTVVVNAPDYQKSNFSILGQVGRPGLYDIPPGAHVSIIDAVSLAGGYSAGAEQDAITVKRMVDGKLAILKVNAAEMAQDPNIVPFEVLPGDSILVLFRNKTFSILGQVNKPGIYEIPEGAHLNIVEAILTAGGYTRMALQNSVTVKRVVDGKPTTIKVKAGDMAQKADLVPFEVLPGDIIKVNESWF